MDANRPKQVAYVFEDIGGWFVCGDDPGPLDTRGTRYDSKNAAIRALRELAKCGQTQYTHYRTGTTKARKL